MKENKSERSTAPARNAAEIHEQQTLEMLRHRLFDITAAAESVCLPAKVRITKRLWEQLAGKDIPFEPLDDRLRTLCWSLVFASNGMSQAHKLRLPGQQIIQFDVACDPPSTLKKVTAIIHLKPRDQKIIFLEACEV